MNLWNHYHIPNSLRAALQILIDAPGPARLIAGGSDLLLDLEQGRHSPVDTLVDVTAIPELNALEQRGEELFIGAAVPLNRIIHSSLVRRHAEALAEACALIGGPQLRNVATLGGNVAHALPAADGTIALLCLGAEVEIADARGEKRVALTDIFLGPGKSSLDPCSQILTGFYLPLSRPHQASAFRRVMRPQGVAIAILNMGVWLQREGERIVDVRIAVGPSGPTPRRMTAAEELLRGQPLSEGILSCASDAVLQQSRYRTSRHRATKEYRRHLTGVLIRDALTIAFQRAAR